MSIGEEMANYVRERDWVTFTELAAWLQARGVPTEGGHQLSVQHGTLVLWADMSPEMVAAVVAMRDYGVTVENGSALAYLCDGGAALDLPVAMRLPKGGYRTPHWVPTYFRPAEAAT